MYDFWEIVVKLNQLSLTTSRHKSSQIKFVDHLVNGLALTAKVADLLKESGGNFFECVSRFINVR